MRTWIETPPVSWLGESPWQIGAVERPSHAGAEPSRFAAGDSGVLQKFLRLTVARRRRLFTVFPCAESPMIVYDAI